MLLIFSHTSDSWLLTQEDLPTIKVIPHTLFTSNHNKYTEQESMEILRTYALTFRHGRMDKSLTFVYFCLLRIRSPLEHIFSYYVILLPRNIRKS